MSKKFKLTIKLSCKDKTRSGVFNFSHSMDAAAKISGNIYYDSSVYKIDEILINMRKGKINVFECAVNHGDTIEVERVV